jgi:hypothetical protein
MAPITPARSRVASASPSPTSTTTLVHQCKTIAHYPAWLLLHHLRRYGNHRHIDLSYTPARASGDERACAFLYVVYIVLGTLYTSLSQFNKQGSHKLLIIELGMCAHTMLRSSHHVKMFSKRKQNRNEGKNSWSTRCGSQPGGIEANP